MTVQERYVSAKEAGLKCGYSAAHVRLLAACGYIVAWQSCGIWIVDLQSVRDYMKGYKADVGHSASA